MQESGEEQPLMQMEFQDVSQRGPCLHLQTYSGGKGMVSMTLVQSKVNNRRGEQQVIHSIASLLQTLISFFSLLQTLGKYIAVMAEYVMQQQMLEVELDSAQKQLRKMEQVHFVHDY